ncbi:hypothetical protein EV359DRAFT_87671, partial [Lentinula novae-zelandiae]
TTEWIDENGVSATAEDLEEKLAEVQGIVKPITTKMYSGGGPSYVDMARFRRCSYLTPPHHQPFRVIHIHLKLTKEAASSTSLFATITITSAPSFLKLATSAPSFLNLLNPYVALPKDPHQPHPGLFVLLPV